MTEFSRVERLDTIGEEERTVTVSADHPNVVSYWNGVANRTVAATSTVDTGECA